MAADGTWRERKRFTPPHPGLSRYSKFLSTHSVLPKDFILKPIRIPERIVVCSMTEHDFVTGWDSPAAMIADWVDESARHNVLSTFRLMLESLSRRLLSATRAFTSSILRIRISIHRLQAAPEPFRFDPRLK